MLPKTDVRCVLKELLYDYKPNDEYQLIASSIVYNVGSMKVLSVSKLATRL